MDKYEYKIKLEQMEKLTEKKDYVTAAKIASAIDWKRVKNINTLLMVGEIFQANGQYAESQEVLLLAYQKAPVGRSILFKLAEGALRMKDVASAVDYYNEFVRLVPNDTSRFLLKYKILKAQGAPLPEQIALLEEYKQYEYEEKWAFELAYLYHKSGQPEKCVEECDDLILWFNEGKYVIKAMELKMRYRPLTLLQQEKYENRFLDSQPDNLSPDVSEENGKAFASGAEEVAATKEFITPDALDFAAPDENFQVPPFRPGNQFDTINLQAELANNLKQVLGSDTVEDEYRRFHQEKILSPVQPVVKEEPVVQELQNNEEDQQIEGQLSLEDVLAGWSGEKPTEEQIRMETVQMIDPITVPTEAVEEPIASLLQTEPIEEELVDSPSQPEPEEESDTFDSIQDIDTEKIILEGMKELEQEAVAPENLGETRRIGSTEEIKAEVRRLTAQAVQMDQKSKEVQVDQKSKAAWVEPASMVAGAKEAVEEPPVQPLTKEQEKMFTYFTPVLGMKEQIAQALHNEKYCQGRNGTSTKGNILLIGPNGTGKTVLGMNLIKAIKKQRQSSSVKAAIITGENLNQKDISTVMQKMYGGALVIERFSDLSPEKVEELTEAMAFDTGELLFIIEDTKSNMRHFFAQYPEFAEKFTTKITIPVFSNDELVSFGKAYAKEQDYIIDDMGILALYNCIGSMQKGEEPVTVSDVKEIIKAAIEKNSRLSLGKIKNIITNKRYDEEDYIILKETDFQA